MKRLSIVLAALIGLAAQSALAQDYARAGMYGQINGVASFESFDGAPSGLFDTGLGASGRLGFRLTPNIAVEGLVEYSGDFVDFAGADFTSTIVAANARYYFLTDQIQPYVSLGVGGGFVDADPGPSDSGFVSRFGGGLDFYLSENWGLTGEFAYNLATGDIDDLNYMTLGWGAFLRF
jgi:opacity protein-like surface antigen